MYAAASTTLGRSLQGHIFCTKLICVHARNEQTQWDLVVFLPFGHLCDGENLSAVEKTLVNMPSGSLLIFIKAVFKCCFDYSLRFYRYERVDIDQYLPCLLNHLFG